MSRTLTALFDTRADAEAAKGRLEAASIDISAVHVHDQKSTGYSESTAYSSREEKGFWSNLKGAFLPDEDRHTYEEGIKRGGALLTAEVDEHNADEAVRILEDANTIDLDDRSANWRESGWDYDKTRNATTGTGAGVGAAVGSALGMGASKGSDMSDRLTTDRVGNEEHIDIVQEDLVIGKREVDRGGVRVRSYMVETPVHEQVTLHEEHVEVERRPVDRKLGAADIDAFREREISMTETSEEAVVGKTARVVEEVVVRKEGSDRTETIDDTVRRTEVDIDDTDTTRTSGTGLGSTDKGMGTSGSGLGGSGMGSGGMGSTGKTDRDRY
ncbi:YsnF/AvaK domain-containing protein [uncultured Sphingomonas sp.]|uniref:YsnF/AvaK domain-containing protein n=1 Tax=uncultured Sphingomonas sp. TaxID=158754 RepID=UPI0035C97326